MNVIGVLLAAGKGTRAQQKKPKQLIGIQNKPLFLYALDALIKSYRYQRILVVASKKTCGEIGTIIEREYRGLPIHIISGGATRQKSIKNSIKYISSNEISCDFILFQDAARPLVAPKEYKKVIGCSLKNDGAILVEPTRGSIAISIQKQRIKDHSVAFPYITHSPECYRFEVLRAIYEKSTTESISRMTNLELMLKHKKNILPVISHQPNLKLTYPEDIASIHKLLS